jgi:hypothetical protein
VILGRRQTQRRANRIRTLLAQPLPGLRLHGRYPLPIWPGGRHSRRQWQDDDQHLLSLRQPKPSSRSQYAILVGSSDNLTQHSTLHSESRLMGGRFLPDAKTGPTPATLDGFEPAPILYRGNGILSRENCRPAPVAASAIGQSEANQMGTIMVRSGNPRNSPQIRRAIGHRMWYTIAIARSSCASQCGRR